MPRQHVLIICTFLYQLCQMALLFLYVSNCEKDAFITVYLFRVPSVVKSQERSACWGKDWENVVHVV